MIPLKFSYQYIFESILSNLFL